MKLKKIDFFEFHQNSLGQSYFSERLLEREGQLFMFLLCNLYNIVQNAAIYHSKITWKMVPLRYFITGTTLWSMNSAFNLYNDDDLSSFDLGIASISGTTESLDFGPSKPYDDEDDVTIYFEPNVRLIVLSQIDMLA